MTTPFIHDDFLLSTPTAKCLFHDHAQSQPIFDYHCHLPPKDLHANRKFANLTEVWLEGDHYKWRAMRAAGVPEELITGKADPYDKFKAWAKTVPSTLRNPLYHWTHLELKRYFGIDTLLDETTTDRVWQTANEQLKSLDIAAIFARFNVALVCTTDDPTDELTLHSEIASRGTYPDTVVYPAFRPDKTYNMSDPAAFNAYVDQIAGRAKSPCRDFEGYLKALRSRHETFHDGGCRLADHGVDCLYAAPCSKDQASAIFNKARNGEAVSLEDRQRFMMFMMLRFGLWDAEKGWVKQLHAGALRSVNSRALREIGPDTGFDSIGDWNQATGLAYYLDTLENASPTGLPRMVLYNLNPSSNYVFGSMIGNFQGRGVAGKMQFGSGWWFLDTEAGMRWQIDALSNLGLLARFVGMLTDSRSFMSYPRHEYFRRVLCDMLGHDVESGRLPRDEKMIGKMVRDICFDNAKNYFGMTLKGRHA
ncbi:MAG: glucuronate isomerase [Phycisphaera sp.]|nr:glucuronate isomerase [Phycisphaera sp.]